ncbi:hypothetical protein CHA01nite_24160 [Chryseobacterium hagamense]|uniref:Uncharacterized protein n=2 Tax=Chryseobacterium hagamense TaxID=395935 RepID=A0A511YNE0_9FLAO|nr:hypothetical protein CHA01nite_24160 [Chryseobacterium hagamense]
MDDRLLEKKTEAEPVQDSLLLHNFSNIPFYKASYTEKDLPYAGKEHFYISADHLPEIYASLISLHPAYIPDIYSNTQKVVYNRKNDLLELTMKNRHGLVAGDFVMIENKDGIKFESRVEEIPNEFTFAVKNNLPKAYSYFVRGKKINDLKQIDRDELLLVEVRVNQLLYRKVCALESETDFMKNKTVLLEKQIQELKHAVHQLKNKR